MALAAGNFDGDPYTDLAIGAPGEDNVLFGSDTGLTFDGDQFWHQNSTDIGGVVESDDEFGHALAAYYRVTTYRIFLPIVQRD